MTTSRTLPWSTSLSSWENEISCVTDRWPGFWNTREQRQQEQDDDHPEGEIAQIRIHPVSLMARSSVLKDVRGRRRHWPNVGAWRRPCQAGLPHFAQEHAGAVNHAVAAHLRTLIRIIVRGVATGQHTGFRPSRGVGIGAGCVRLNRFPRGRFDFVRGLVRNVRNFSGSCTERCRRAGALSTMMRSFCSDTMAPASVRRKRFAPAPRAAASAVTSVSSLPSSTGPSSPVCATARPRRRSAISAGSSRHSCDATTSLGAPLCHLDRSDAASTTVSSAASLRRTRRATSASRCAVRPSCSSRGISRRSLARAKRGSALLASSAKRHAGPLQGGDEPGLGQIEERPHHPYSGALPGADRRRSGLGRPPSLRLQSLDGDFARHAGEPGNAAAAGDAQQQRLGLIVARVAGKDEAGPRTARGLMEQPITRRSGFLLQGGGGFRSAPSLGAMRHPEGGSEALDLGSLAA